MPPMVIEFPGLVLYFSVFDRMNDKVPVSGDAHALDGFPKLIIKSGLPEEHGTDVQDRVLDPQAVIRSEEHTSELQSH